VNVTDVITKLRTSAGTSWKDPSWDGLQSGSMDAVVTGIAVTWAPSLVVLKDAVARGCNTIVCKAPVYWFDPQDRPSDPDSMYLRLPEGSMGIGKMDAIEKSAAYRAKKDFIASNNLNIYRISENWDGGQQLPTVGLLNVLGWKQTDSFVADERFPNTHTAIVSIPSQDLIQVAEHAKKSVASKSARLLGDRSAKVAKVAVHPGFMTVFAATRIGKTPGLDMILTGEANEWEAFVYSEDWITAGHGKGLLLLGLAATSDAGAKEVANWVRKAAALVKVEFFAVGDPLNPARGGTIRV
jgi:putative NIF3 family GTP cyclohydrolase 1 type 2